METNLGCRWYESPHNMAHGEIFSVIDMVDKENLVRKRKLIEYLETYQNRSVSGLGAGSYAIYKDSTMALRENIIKVLVDTVVSKVATNKVKPMFSTDDGGHSSKKKAKQLNKFSLGMFRQSGFYNKARDAMRDAALFGNGFLKFYDDGSDICLERVFPWEVIVDDEECKYGEPRSLFQHKEISRDVLKRKFHKFKSEIDYSSVTRDSDEGQKIYRVADMVSVVEAWHLPTGKGQHDGRHVICCNNVTLLDETWSRMTYPIVKFSWSKVPLGYWDIGLAEEIWQLHKELDYLYSRAQEQMDCGGTYIVTRSGEGVNPIQLTNEPVSIIELPSVQDISVITPRMVAPEIWEQIERVRARCYEVARISQMTAHGKKPDGIDSGKALREYYDIESEGFKHVMQMFEESCIECTKQLIGLARDISERGEGGSYEIMATDGKDVERIKWSDVSIDDNRYVIHVEPTDMMPATTPGKIQLSQELMQMGLFGPERIMKMLDLPDTESEIRRINAIADTVEKSIEMMLENGEPVIPDPYMLGKAQYIVESMSNAYLEASLRKYPEERLQLLRNYINAVESMTRPPQPPAQVQMVEPAMQQQQKPTPGQQPMM